MMGGPHDFSVRPSPLGTNLGFELGCTGLGLSLGGIGTKGLGPMLDKICASLHICILCFKDCVDLWKSPNKIRKIYLICLHIGS